MSTIINQAILILCFVAGKSGGHLLPCLTQAEKILEMRPTSQIYLFSSGTQLDHKIMEKHPLIHHYVPAIIEGIPYVQPWLFPIFFWNISSYFFHSLYALWNLHPEKIISFGGLNSIPVCIAGKILGIPFDLYELNVEPGKSVQFLSYFTDTLYICFSQTAQYFTHKKCILTEYPVRFRQQDRIYNRQELLEQYNLQNDRKTVLILGGSQGSLFLNQAIKACVQSNDTLKNNIQIIHQIGIYDQDNYKKFYKEHAIPAIVFAYNERLQDFYNLADLIICRAGAGTLFEVAFFKKDCIIIPLETQLNNHQLQNAQAMQAMHPEYFSVVLQANSKEQLLHAIAHRIKLDLL